MYGRIPDLKFIISGPPIKIDTPIKPITTPLKLPKVIGSSRVKKCAVMTPNKGVVAFRIEARLPDR